MRNEAGGFSCAPLRRRSTEIIGYIARATGGRLPIIGVGGITDAALNLLAGQVSSVVPVGNRVRVRIGPLTAEVTAASAEKLELARGGTAYASFKATGTRLVPL